MSALRDNAATLAGRAEQNGRAEATDPSPRVPAQRAPEPLPEVDIPAPDAAGPEEVPVHVAWSRVMETVRYAEKKSTPDSGPRFNYRGVDQALNLFGPACRLHGVLVLPVNVEATYRDTTNSNGKPQRECTVIVTYRIVGPKGDHLELQAAGESLDSGDKGTAKAQAIALRTLLYHAGLVPTRDVDPDAVNVERGTPPLRPLTSYLDEVMDPETSRARLEQIWVELRTQQRLVEVVSNETGDDERIGDLIKRIGKERFASPSGS